jgi:hypothetical protein
MQNQLNDIMSRFYEKQDLFYHSIMIFFEEEPRLIDTLTFSTIPGFFNFFTIETSAQLFLKFIFSIKENSIHVSLSLSRILLVLPSTHLFIESLTEGFFERISIVSDKQFIKQFCENVISKWNDHIEFCPKIIRDLVSQFEEPDDVLFNLLIVYLFDSS